MREASLILDRRQVLAGSAAAGTVLLAGAIGAAAVEHGPCFTTDIRLPGLLHAVVARPPVFGARLIGLDASKALAIPGVARVVDLPTDEGSSLTRLGGVAVLAGDTWTALKGRDALGLSWSTAVDDALRPDVAEGFISETAEPLFEPPSAIVQACIASCSAWVRVRDAEAARAVLARRLGLDIAAVAVHTTRQAAGADRFTDPGYLFEAARLSRAMGDVPVSLVWTAMDDMPLRARPSTVVA